MVVSPDPAESTQSCPKCLVQAEATVPAVWKSPKRTHNCKTALFSCMWLVLTIKCWFQIPESLQILSNLVRERANTSYKDTRTAYNSPNSALLVRNVYCTMFKAIWCVHGAYRFSILSDLVGCRQILLESCDIQSTECILQFVYRTLATF